MECILQYLFQTEHNIHHGMLPITSTNLNLACSIEHRKCVMIKMIHFLYMIQKYPEKFDFPLRNISPTTLATNVLIDLPNRR